MKILPFFLILSLTFINVDEELHKKCIYPTIYLSNQKDSGSGVIVRSEKIGNYYVNLFLTAEHVVRDFDNFRAFQFNYKNWSTLDYVVAYPSEIIDSNKDMDIAMGYFLSDNQMPTADVDNDYKIYIGSNVLRIGCGANDEPRIDYGKITGMPSTASKNKNLFRTNCHTVPGDSGGPLYFNNKVIAIARSIRVVQDQYVFSFSYMTPVRDYAVWNPDYDFIWDDSKKMPRLSVYKLELKEYNVLGKI